MQEKHVWLEMMALPRAWLAGLIGGLLGPVLALAGAVGLLYWATGKLPAIQEIVGDDGTHQRAITLVRPLEARATWARYGGELRGAMLALKARRSRE